MGIAYLDRALKMNDRIKGYTVYGTLAEYQLTDLDGYENITEKVAGKLYFIPKFLNTRAILSQIF